MNIISHLSMNKEGLNFTNFILLQILIDDFWV